jgi:hypothetical protein
MGSSLGSAARKVAMTHDRTYPMRVWSSVARPRWQDVTTMQDWGGAAVAARRGPGVTAATLTGWCDAFLAAGEAALTSQPTTGEALENDRANRARPNRAGALSFRSRRRPHLLRHSFPAIGWPRAPAFTGISAIRHPANLPHRWASEQRIGRTVMSAGSICAPGSVTATPTLR